MMALLIIILAGVCGGLVSLCVSRFLSVWIIKILNGFRGIGSRLCLSGIQMVSAETAEFNCNHLQSNKQSVISILGLLLVSKQLGAQSPRKPLVAHYVIIV